MRYLTPRLGILLLTFLIGVTSAIVWALYRKPAVESLGLPACASPPSYELISVPCSEPNLSSLANLPLSGYCEMAARSAPQAGRLVRVKGVYYRSSENSALNDPQCSDQNNWTWIEFEPYANREDSLKVMEQAPRLRSNQRRAEVIFLGKFYGPNANGYGHLNDYRFKLSVMKIEKIVPLTIDAR